jgi:hypothetical protein
MFDQEILPDGRAPRVSICSLDSIRLADGLVNASSEGVDFEPLLMPLSIPLSASGRSNKAGNKCSPRGFHLSRHLLRPLAKVSSLILLGFLLLLPLISLAQPKSELGPPPPLDPAEGERQASELIARLLEQKPEQPATNSGVLKIRDADSNQREVPARFEIVPTPSNWLNVYQASTTANSRTTKLTIVHCGSQPNQYFLNESGGAEITNSATRKLVPNELMLSFAGSDFWIVDLGLEFLHWPQQRVLRKQMRKGQSCDVLQSTNPQPVPGGYSRVVSWIAINLPEDIVIVHAEAFDARDKLLKEFDPKKVEKINGVWQLEEMEIRNRQTGTRTRIDFNLDGH